MVLYSLAINSPFIYAAKLGKKVEQTIFFFIILNKTPFFLNKRHPFGYLLGFYSLCRLLFYA